jgi:ABC-type transport system involved in cytochrome c biogenesis permease subunit
MCAHFLLILWRFLDRRQREQSQAALRKRKRIQEDPYDIGTLVAKWALPAAVVLFAAMWIGGKTRVPATPTGHVDLTAFGNLPIVYEGRPKPIDTLARNSLLIVSDRQDFTGRMDPQTWREKWDEIRKSLRKEWPELSDDDLKPFRGGDQPLSDLVDLVVAETDADRQEAADFVYEATSAKQPAIRWLLDVITASRAAREHRVFKIENLGLLETLGLPRRSGFRYAIEEIEEDKLQDYLEELHEAEETKAGNPENLTFYQRKVLDLSTKLTVFQRLNSAFVAPSLPPLPDRELQESDPDQAMQMLRRSFSFAIDRLSSLEDSRLPLAIPYEQPEAEQELLGPAADWLPYSTAYLRASLMAQLMGAEPPDTIVELNEVLVAYSTGEVDEFNDAVDDYAGTIAAELPDDVSMRKIRFESFFNHAAPFYYAAWLYLFAFILTAFSWLFSWLGWSRPLSRAAFCLIAFTFLVHILAIAGRIYISGRPPVTNLYSSAVFIGLGGALLGIVLELLYRIGVGNVVAAVTGGVTLGIAHFLAGDGDTFTVLQAVLDTQFWLATHVVCITLGYATTYVAGTLGICYILCGVFTPALTPTVGRAITRMTYGALCFAILFSFFGTVLGGLWADDSWGRFWGWDPKENGALIIVLWNALVLHARWDGMVRQRGLAILTVLGNIAVSWSWFGVNELGVGLHSYGFTEGVLLALGLYCLSQLVIVAIGSVPQKFWWSSIRSEAEQQSQVA